MTFKCLEVFQLLVKVFSHMWGLWIVQGHLFQAGPEERQRGKGRSRASRSDPTRICGIKSLHLDVIVLSLCWDLPLPQGDQISATEKWRPVKTYNLTWYNILPRENASLALLVNDYELCLITETMPVISTCTTHNNTAVCNIFPKC